MSDSLRGSTDASRKQGLQNGVHILLTDFSEMVFRRWTSVIPCNALQTCDHGVQRSRRAEIMACRDHGVPDATPEGVFRLAMLLVGVFASKCSIAR